MRVDSLWTRLFFHTALLLPTVRVGLLSLERLIPKALFQTLSFIGNILLLNSYFFHVLTIMIFMYAVQLQVKNRNHGKSIIREISGKS